MLLMSDKTSKFQAKVDLLFTLSTKFCLKRVVKV